MNQTRSVRIAALTSRALDDANVAQPAHLSESHGTEGYNMAAEQLSPPKADTDMATYSVARSSQDGTDATQRACICKTPLKEVHCRSESTPYVRTIFRFLCFSQTVEWRAARPCWQVTQHVGGFGAWTATALVRVCSPPNDATDAPQEHSQRRWAVAEVH